MAAALKNQVLLGKASLSTAAKTQAKLARDAAAMADWAKQEHRVRKQWVSELETELEKERQTRKDWVESLEKEVEKQQKIREDWVAALEKEAASVAISTLESLAQMNEVDHLGDGPSGQ